MGVSESCLSLVIKYSSALFFIDRRSKLVACHYHFFVGSDSNFYHMPFRRRGAEAQLRTITYPLLRYLLIRYYITVGGSVVDEQRAERPED